MTTDEQGTGRLHQFPFPVNSARRTGSTYLATKLGILIETESLSHRRKKSCALPRLNADNKPIFPKEADAVQF